jgi:hypothetical protein
VATAIHENRWISDIQGTPTLQAISEFVLLWTCVQDQPPLNSDEDSFIWQLTTNGKYSPASAYKAFFNGTIEADYARALWKNWAPLKEKIFCWLAIKNRCWTEVRLLKRGLNAPDNYVLCDQEPEDINHLVTRCVFAREFWHRFSSARGTADMTPMRFESVRQWWCSITSSMPRNKRKEKTVMAIPGMRRLWLERNSRTFDRKSSPMNSVVDAAIAEFDLWA